MDSRRHPRRPRAIALVAVALSTVACGAGPPAPDRMAAEASRLGEVVPILERLGLTDFEDSAWCRNLANERGAFGNLDQDGCEREGTVEFDAVALADHALVARAIQASGVAIDRVQDVTYGPDGDLTSARFVLEDSSTTDTGEYLYDQAGLADTTDVPGRRDVTRIDDEWWFVLSLDD